MLIATEKMLSRPVSVPQPVNLAGIPVIPFESYDQALACIDHTLESGQKTFWVAINPQKCYRAWRERDLLSVLNRANAGICDGIGVSVAAMILHGRRIKRCTGCDLFFKVLPHAERKGWRIFMLGASAESNARARARLLEMHPNLKIVGSQDGFFQDSQAVVEKINRSDADLLFVAMGSPKQEYWISRYRPEINAPFCMGVGGSFDVASGMIRRAPKFFRATGTEWLFQLMTEPHKRLRRQLVYVPFMLRVLREKLLGSSEPESMEEELESARQS